MKVTTIAKKPMPLIPETNDDPPSKKPKTLWQRFIGKLNTAAFHISRFYFWTKLNWLLPVLALLAITWLFAFCALESWFVKEKVITVAPWNFVRTAKAAEVTVDRRAGMTVEEYTHYKFGKHANTVLAIMKAESGGNPYAINKNNDKGGTFDLGCMQLNEKWQLKPRGLTREDAFDCKKSLDVSYQIYQEQGNFCAWYGYRRLYPKNCS